MIKLETHFEINFEFSVSWSQFCLFVCMASLCHLLGFGMLIQNLLPKDESPHWPTVTCPWQVNSNVKASSDQQGQLVALSHTVSYFLLLTRERNEVRWEYESGQLEPHSGNTDSNPFAQINGQWLDLYPWKKTHVSDPRFPLSRFFI